MNIPRFDSIPDPGPSFIELLRQSGLGSHTMPDLSSGDLPAITQGTTVVAIRFADGVVMAGDRRATSGHLISHRTIEKVFEADRHSGIAIAGAAGPAIEMVRLFQLQLEHYEKVEGSELSLEGKANQLSQMLRNHLPAAMQGLAVVPIFAGFDDIADEGRLFQYDVTGGRYEERHHATSGSGSLHAGTVIKVRYRDAMTHDEVIDVAIESLYQAADADSATGGPDMLRGIFPVVAVITADGFERISDDELRSRYNMLIERLTDIEQGGRP